MSEETVVCVTFKNEEEGLRYLSRVAQLQPGTIISWKTTTGIHRGVVVKLHDNGRVVVTRFIGNDIACCRVHPGCIVFDDMSCEYEEPQEEVDESVDIDDLPRT